MNRRTIAIRIMTLCFLHCIFCQGKEKPTALFFPDDSTYLPLTIGSYWVYRDSFFTNENLIAAKEGSQEDPEIIVKDSVINLNKSNGEFSACLIRTYLNRPALKPDTIIYQIDIAGKVFSMDSDKEGQPRRRSDMWIAKISPNENDTASITGRKTDLYTYNKFNFENSFILKSIKEKRYNQISSVFKKGIGCIGKIRKNSSTNLVEYRIGNGPVIKKHWLMESLGK